MDFILRGEYDSPKISVFTSNVYGTCRTSWEDPITISEYVKADPVEVRTVPGGILIVGSGRFEIYGTSGRLVTRGKVERESRVRLTPGTYVIRLDGKALRIVVR